MFKKGIKNTVKAIGTVVVIVYAATTIGLGIVYGGKLGGLISANPAAAIIGGFLGAGIGFTLGATTGLRALDKFRRWVDRWE